MYFFLKMREVC